MTIEQIKTKLDHIENSGDWNVESGKTYTLYLSGTIGGTPFEASPVTRTAP